MDLKEISIAEGRRLGGDEELLGNVLCLASIATKELTDGTTMLTANHGQYRSRI